MKSSQDHVLSTAQECPLTRRRFYFAFAFSARQIRNHELPTRRILETKCVSRVIGVSLLVQDRNSDGTSHPVEDDLEPE